LHALRHAWATLALTAGIHPKVVQKRLGHGELLTRMAVVKRGEAVLVHGAAGRVGTAVLELGALAGVRLYGTVSARDRTAVERLGAVAIDYRTEDFLARVRELTGNGVDVALDGLGGVTSLRSSRALRPGGRLVLCGHYATLAGARAGEAGSSGMRRPREWRCGACSRPAGGCSPTGSNGCVTVASGFRSPVVVPRVWWVGVRATPTGSGKTSVSCSSCFVRTRFTQ
jgi:Zinc-binding dehydrogenase